MILYRIVETDNLGGDYPDEKFVSLPLLSRAHADAIAKAINDCLCPDDPPGSSTRFWKVVENGYKLAPGFEP